MFVEARILGDCVAQTGASGANYLDENLH